MANNGLRAAVFALNSAAHVAAVASMRKNGASLAEMAGTAAYVPINAALALGALTGSDYLGPATSALPAVGGLGLAATMRSSKANPIINLAILGLDVTAVALDRRR